MRICNYDKLTGDADVASPKLSSISLYNILFILTIHMKQRLYYTDTMLQSVVVKRTDLRVTDWASNPNANIYQLGLEQVT